MHTERSTTLPRTIALHGLSVTFALVLAACGGGGGSASSPSPSPAPVESPTPPAPPPPPPAAPVSSSFPVGLSVSSPGDLGSGNTSVAMAPISSIRVAGDWMRATWAALRQGNTHELGRLASLAMPVGTAHAAGATPEAIEAAELIRKVVEGDTTVSIDNLINLPALFGMGHSNANCYGPHLLYQNHQDGPDGSPAQLPSGDVGIWLATEDTNPCVTAQLSKRVKSAKKQGLQGLLMAAIMRRAVSTSTTVTLPTAGNSTDLTTDMSATLSGLASVPATVETATIALDSTGAVYTYRIVLVSTGTGPNAKRGEMILRHTPGGSASAYSGVLQVAGFHLDNDMAFGCDDQKSGAAFKVARVSTLRYDRSGTNIAFASRSAQYCGHPATGTGSDDAAQVASFDSNHELDPSVKITGMTRGSTLGWRGNFTRYAGNFDKDTAEGRFLLAWQAGTGDGFSRAMAATTTVNTSTLDRTVTGYFAYGDEIASSAVQLQGMICNWAGPGNSHTPAKKFQMQTAVLASGASAYTLGSSLITYAPTNSCNSTTTSFDVNSDGSLSANEGVGTTNNLDGLTGANTTVDQEITSRGWSKPSLF